MFFIAYSFEGHVHVFAERVNIKWKLNENKNKYMYATMLRGQKFHSSARNYEWNLERISNSSQSHCPVG